MKRKLIINMDGEIIQKVANFTEEDGNLIITYKETPTSMTKITIADDYLHISRNGQVKISYKHELGVKSKCKYIVQMGEQSFAGQSTIKTTKIEQHDGKIVLEYTRDKEKVFQSWVY